MKTIGKVLIAIGVIAAILLIINMGLLKSGGGRAIFNVAPTYEYPTDIPCSTTQDCINYATQNGATNTDSRCDKNTCTYIVTEPINNVVKGGELQ